MRKQIQKFFWKLLERELMTVLAVSFVSLTILFTQAATTNLSFTILSPGGDTVTVTAPNGGESWTIGETETITWTSSGSITDVKIELQRATAGSWEELTASTTNDGSYPWVVTGTATTEATVRISKVGDATVNDISNAVFSIVTAPSADSGTSGGFYVEPVPYQPAINEVAPRSFGNYVATELIVRGVNFRDGAIVRLGGQELSTRYVASTEVRATAPINFLPGSYTVYLVNPDGRQAQYALPVAVYKLTIAPPSTGGVNEIYAAKWLKQSATKLTAAPSEEVTVWVEFRNVGNMPWTSFGNNPVRLGVTNPQDHISILRGSNWVVDNRPAVMQGINTVDPKIVNPGEVARFTFTLKAPTRAGRYRESFLPVVEYKTWMRGKIAVFSLNVVVKKTVGRAKLPSTGGTWTPTSSSLLFLDGTEALFSKIARGAADLWGTLTAFFSRR